jgi:hypothetical protein
LAPFRDLIHDPLFVRTPKGVEPIIKARELIDPVREALGLIGWHLGTGAELDWATYKRVFRVVVVDSMKPIIVPPALVAGDLASDNALSRNAPRARAWTDDDIIHGQRFRIPLAGHHDRHGTARLPPKDNGSGPVLRRRPTIAPLRQRKDGRIEVAPLRGEMILRPRPPSGLRVILPLQHARLRERLQSGAQYAAPALQRAGKIIEPAQSIHRFAQYQKRPLLAQHIECPLKAAY